ncbi:MAG: O-antigen ligase family protein [Anaerolineae bacterium]|nr:O-antigen ligase family protein [Anaerolineae bacterium]
MASTPALLKTLFGFAVGLAAMLLVSLAITAFPRLTWPQVLRTAVGIALCFAMVHWVGLARQAGAVARVHVLATTLTVVCLSLALAEPFIVNWQESAKFPIIPMQVYTGFTRVMADGVNPNVMAGALVILLPLPLSSLLFASKLLRVCTLRAAWPWIQVIGLPALAMLVTVPMLVLTQSRGAFIAFVASVALLFVLRSRKSLVPVLAVIILLTVFWIAQPSALNAFATTLAASSTNGLDNRIEIWSRAWYMVQDFAFTGIGMGSFEQVTEMLYPLIITPPGVPHAHNLFLQIAVDLGVPGLIAWLGILITVIVSSWRAYRSADSTLRALGAGLLASQVALCVHGLTDAVTWGMVRSAPLVWALWGAAVAAGLAARGSGVDQPPALTGPSRSVESRDGDQREHGQHHHAPNPPIPDHTGHAPMSVHLADQRRPAVCQSQQAGDDGRIRVARAGQP